MRGFGLCLLFILAFDGHASKCSTVNFKYKFCHEDWVSEPISKGLIEALDNMPLRTNLWQRSYSKNDTLFIVLEIKSDDVIDELSEMPGEFKNEGMEEALGSDYSGYFAFLYHSYVLGKARNDGGAVDKERVTKESYFEKMNVKMLAFRFNILNRKGALAKEYNLTNYGLSAYLKLVKKQLGIQGDEED